MIITRPPDPSMPPDWDPYAEQQLPEAEPVPDHSKVADVSNIAGLAIMGLSLADIQFILQLVALGLGIIATSITIAVHLRRWLKGKAK